MRKRPCVSLATDEAALRRPADAECVTVRECMLRAVLSSACRETLRPAECGAEAARQPPSELGRVARRDEEGAPPSPAGDQQASRRHTQPAR